MTKQNKYTYLILAIGFIIAATIIENILLKNHPEATSIQEFQQKLVKNEQKLHRRLSGIKQELENKDIEAFLDDFYAQKNTRVNQSGFGYLIYQDSILVFWSDRAIAFYDKVNKFEQTKGLIALPNGYYLIDSVSVGNYQIFGLHLLKNKYTFENKYLQNSFSADYSISNDYAIDTCKHNNAYTLKDAGGNFLFALLPYGRYIDKASRLYIPGILYLVGLILLLVFLRKGFIEARAPFIVKLIALGFVLLTVYWAHLFFMIPRVFYHLKLFGPDYFALNDWLPSLGDYFLCSVFFLFWIYNFAIDLRLSGLRKKPGFWTKIMIAALFLFTAVLFVFIHHLIRELIYNSTISFSLNKINDISFQSAVGIFSVGLFLLGEILLSVRLVDKSKMFLTKNTLFVYALSTAIFVAIIQLFIFYEVSVLALVLFIAGIILSSLISRKYLETFTLSYLVIYVSVVSVYSLIVINQTISQKERGQQKVLAVRLETDRDPTAEVFLSEIQDKIEQDTAIQYLLQQKNKVEEYIRKSYFNSYFRKYELNIYVCAPNDNLDIRTEEVPCMPFMNELIENQGVRIPGTDFYFMNNMNGRVSYTGRLEYTLDGGRKVNIYIDLDSELVFRGKGIGFPELLIDKSLMHSDIYQKFSNAKYYGGELTDKFGDYNYNYNGHVYLKSNKEFSAIRQDKYEHLVYHTQGNNFIVVTRKVFTFIDYLIAFPYLFVFYFLLLVLILIIGNSAMRERQFVFNMKFKIQAAIISIVFVSLLVVAIVTISYNLKQYDKRHHDDLNEKMKSIAEELDLKLADKLDITPDLRAWIYNELVKLSNIFRTDINVYGTYGDLIASSRDEIFEKGLVAPRINARAYYEVFQNFKGSYSQTENIGALSYLSAYRPIINDSGDYLGFINLPYFIKQDSYKQEISTYVVAFINLYVLLFLASIIIAVFIANQITRPLVLIQENLRKMQLGRRNEPIMYGRKDEIGSLVEEYNKKVEELAESAELLAKSERESAWREMAKQIAHEIKNPLTPMKLNIQQLQRAKGTDEKYNAHLDRVANILIEQIDNLSNIATEFSNFAKIPTASNQLFFLKEQLQKTIELYQASRETEIRFIANNYETLKVNADKEQLSRAVINLVKNAIQSVPQGQTPKIKIELSYKAPMAVIAITDNGTGIPAELKNKLFTPSFTTKTSGMGLGLAIVKNIVENFSGKIGFETEPGKGTTFFVEIPVYSEENEY